ncbi:MAG: amidohydrolase family protein [Gammaproteobacteria bacterium]|jgi:imidazolonepropionase-like amidohydrolase|nr:amidohydrolase family protein [Gammaproteobacteria bacterium]
MQKRTKRVVKALALGLIPLLAFDAMAQDLTITNARIIMAPGNVIENGSIVVEDGRISSVSSGAPGQTVGQVINAEGMTAMAGFIDDHKHVRENPDFAAQMMSLLEAGYTTVLNGSGETEVNLRLSNLISSGEVVGPNLIPSVSISLRQTPAEARAAIRAMADAGVYHTGEIALTPEPGPSSAELTVLSAILDEAEQVGVQVNVHAVSSPATVAAAEIGVTRFVHLPNKDWTSYDQAEVLAENGAIISGLIAFGAPTLERESAAPAPVQYPRDNMPRFRDGNAWPEAIAGANRDTQGRATGTEGGYTIINARRVWDADPSHRTISYSTDQNFADISVLEHELKSFSIVFSMTDIHQIMGPNSARYLDMEDEIGTLEPGKRADIILQSGDPTENIYGMLTNMLTIVGGEVVVDKR